MCEPNERNYYEGRWEQSIELGDQAKNSRVATVHYEFALRYAMLAAHGSPARPDVVVRAKLPGGETSRHARTIFRNRAEPVPSQAPQNA
jgi:hypothetical protein